MRGEERSWRAAAAGILVAAAGCEVRDELAQPPAPGWQATAAAPRPSFPAGTTQPTAIEAIEGYASGRQRAAEDRRPMLLVFRGTWCRWSAALTRGALADRRVVELARQFVCVTIDADRDADACRRFGIDRFPAVVLIDAAGDERFRVTGATAAGLADAMAGVLATAPDRMAAGHADALR